MHPAEPWTAWPGLEGTQIYVRLFCNVGECIEKNCGAEGQECCGGIGGDCDGTLTCDGDTCRRCGRQGQACCMDRSNDPENWCDGTLTCVSINGASCQPI